MRLVQFIGAPNSPQAGRPVFGNPEAVGVVVEGQGSKDGSRATAIHCGGFPVLVAGSLEETLQALTSP